jgi:hypothetical protein
MPDHLVRVAINDRMPTASSITMVGNWFLAESVSVAIGGGYQQTIFTRHAPNIQARLELFDRELKGLLSEQPGGPVNSKEYAITVLRDSLKTI